MNETWNSFLAAQAPPLPAPLEEAAPFFCDLPETGLLAFTGADAETFLHGQLSCDVKNLERGRWLPASYSTAKGRALATPLLWRADDGFIAQLPAEIAEPVRKRLAMYVLRAKVVCADATDAYVRLGLGDTPDAAVTRGLLADALPPEGAALAQVALRGDGGPVADWLLRLPGARCEFLFASAEAARQAWDLLARVCPRAPLAAWSLRAIRAGVAEVVAATQEQFVPQMLNLDLLGAISFTKGCYPGQEIVARTHYLGRAKRRMHRARVDAGAVSPGDALFCPALPGQPVGTVAAAAPAGTGGSELLAVLQDDLAAREDVTLRDPQGPRLAWLPLPYPLPPGPPAG